MKIIQHWLTQPRTIRHLWVAFAVVLTVTVLIELTGEIHGHFGIDSSFGFHAWYGLLTCVAMIATAKLLGIFLNRKDSYYDE